MNWKGLIADDKGNVTTNKMWKHVAFFTATYTFAQIAASASWEIWLVYLAVVGGSEMANKLIQARKDIALSKTDKSE